MLKFFTHSILSVFLWAAFAASACLGADELRVDCSSAKTMNESVVKIMMSLDDSRQQQFTAALASIGVAGMQEGTQKVDVRKLLDGKTVDEIIAIGRRLAPALRSNRFIVNGASDDAFSKSLGEMLLALSAQRQPKFSEALAKIMYASHQKGETAPELRKRLDGKTAEEIIAMASGEKSPVPQGVKNIEEYDISPVTSESAEKYLGIDKKKPEESFGESLAPSSNVGGKRQ